MSLARAGTFLFRYRNFMVPFAFLLVFVPGPRISPDPFPPLLAGAAIAIFGQLLRALTIGLKYIVRGGQNRCVYADNLVTEGSFAHTRNPLYLGNIAILSGIAIASNSWACALVAVPLALFVYSAIVAAEEQYLRGRFGAAYDEYARAVPRWWVKFGGIRKTLHGSKFHWRRLLAKEYGTTAAWMLALSVTAWLSLERAAAAASADWLRAVLLVCMASAVLFWIAARWLKKSHIVVAD